MSIKKTHTATIYYCMMSISIDENNVETIYNVFPTDVTILNNGIGPFLTNEGKYVYTKSLDKITKLNENCFEMWSLRDNMEKFKEKMIIYIIDEALKNIKEAIYLTGYRPSVSEYNDIVKYINKFIKTCKDKSKKSDEYNTVLNNMDVAHFNPYTMNIDDYKKSEENTDM